MGFRQSQRQSCECAQPVIYIEERESGQGYDCSRDPYEYCIIGNRKFDGWSIAHK